MVVTIQITVDGETLERSVDPDGLTLGFLEQMEAAQESKRWRDLIPAIASLLRLTPEQTRHVSIGQFKQITSALNGAAQVDPTPA